MELYDTIIVRRALHRPSFAKTRPNTPIYHFFGEFPMNLYPKTPNPFTKPFHQTLSPNPFTKPFTKPFHQTFHQTFHRTLSQNPSVAYLHKPSSVAYFHQTLSQYLSPNPSQHST